MTLVLYTLLVAGLQTSEGDDGQPDACPAQAALEQALRDVGEEPENWARYDITVDREGDLAVLTVTPLNADEAVVRRSIRVQGDCEEVAATVAVILASLKTELPGFPSTVELPARVLPPAPPADEPTATSRVVAPTDPAPRTAPLSLSITGGLTMGGGQSSPTFQFGASAAPFPVSFLQLAALIRYVTRIETDLGPGTASWDRWSIAVAPVGAFDLGVADLRVSLGPQLSRLGIRGRGYPEDRSATTIDWGLTAGAQLALGRGGWQPLLGVQTSYWPGDQRLSLVGAPQQAEVARWDFFASVGVFLPVK